LIEAVIFDLDGTLIHLPIDYERLFREFGNIMKTDNVRPLTKTVSRLDEKTRKQLFKAWDRAEVEALAHMTTNDEGIALYKKYSEKPKVLVTMQGKALVKTVLEHLGLSFDVVITRENCLDRAEQLKTAAEKLRTSLPNILFIGNTDEDRLTAKMVSCQFLRVRE
jgi:HAD superfamily hydrolase (TIGR01549 family)